MFKPKISDKKLKELAAAEGDAEFEVKPPEPRSFPPRTRIVLQRNEEPPRLTVYSVDFLDELPLGLHGWLTTAEHETLVAAARAEAFEEAFDVVDRRRTQQEVMAGFGDACMKELSKRAVEARLPGKGVERPGGEK